MDEDELAALNAKLQARRRAARDSEDTRRADAAAALDDVKRRVEQRQEPPRPAQPKPRSAPTRGGFFVIELESFHDACALGLRPAVALLILSRFTGRGGTLTRASVNSIEKRTGIGRKAAREAIEALVARGIIRREGSATKPRFVIVRIADRPDPRGSLTEAQRSVVARALRGEKLSKRDAAVAANLAARGFVKRTPSGGFEEVPRDDATPVWLPNELVDGVNGNPSPVELVRQTGDVMTLRLLVDLYEAHRLDEWCGVDPRMVRERYKELYRHERGVAFVLVFEASTLEMWPEKPVTKPHVVDGDARAFWPRLKTLQNFAIVRFVPHVVDGDAAVVYPCAPSSLSAQRRGEAAEARIGDAAFVAASNILEAGTEESEAFEEAVGIDYDVGVFVPNDDIVVAVVPRHMEKASVIGVARLTFRPKTRATTAWLSELAQTAEQWEANFASAEKGQTLGIVGLQTADGA
jgi:hypothetical protein